MDVSAGRVRQLTNGVGFNESPALVARRVLDLIHKQPRRA